MALPGLDAFFTLSAAQRAPLLLEGIRASHRYHFDRNAAYRRSVRARGVGDNVRPDDLPRLLRPAALTFKSYVETIGPFPQDDPRGFLAWLGDQLSIPLPQDRRSAFRRWYPTMEGLLAATERAYAELGLETVTSSGTSGVASVVARDATTVELAVRSFFTGIQRSWGISRDAALVFVMPENRRVAMARSARIGTRQLDWAAGTAVYYTMPFSATPDRIRLRAGRTYHPGPRGVVSVSTVPEASGLGAAICAGAGAGVFADLPHGAERVRTDETGCTSDQHGTGGVGAGRRPPIRLPGRGQPRHFCRGAPGFRLSAPGAPQRHRHRHTQVATRWRWRHTRGTWSRRTSGGWPPGCRLIRS